MDLPIDRIALARAFDLVWASYEQRGKSTLEVETARAALAKFLVSLAREGTTEETALAAAGVEYLVSLKPRDDEPKRSGVNQGWSIRYDGVQARMIDYWRVTFVPIGKA